MPQCQDVSYQTGIYECVALHISGLHRGCLFIQGKDGGFGRNGMGEREREWRRIKKGRYKNLKRAI